MRSMSRAGRISNLQFRTVKKFFNLSESTLYPNGKKTDPAAFFNTLLATYERAEKKVGSVDCFYHIAGYAIRLKFAGPTLVPFMTPALEHLSCKPSATVAFTVCLFDSISTNTLMPPPPWSSEDYWSRGEIRGYNDNHTNTHFHMGSGALSMFSKEKNCAVFWIKDATKGPYYETAAPVLPVFHWWMREHERQLVHAGAVGMAQGGALIVGKGGSGKSTTTLLSLQSDLFYAGDDYVIIGTQPVLFVYSLYNSAKVNSDHVRNMPHLDHAIRNKEKLHLEKALIFVREHWPEKIIRGFPVKVILTPRITGLPGTTLTQTSPSALLKAVAPSTIFQLAAAGAGDFQRLGDFVKRAPVYILEVGTDLSQIPRVISSILKKEFL